MIEPADENDNDVTFPKWGDTDNYGEPAYISWLGDCRMMVWQEGRRWYWCYDRIVASRLREANSEEEARNAVVEAVRQLKQSST